MDNASGNGNAGLTFTASPAIVSGRGVGTKGSGRKMVSAARIKRRSAALPGLLNWISAICPSRKESDRSRQW